MKKTVFLRKFHERVGLSEIAEGIVSADRLRFHTVLGSQRVEVPKNVLPQFRHTQLKRRDCRPDLEIRTEMLTETDIL